MESSVGIRDVEDHINQLVEVSLLGILAYDDSDKVGFVGEHIL